MFQYKTVTKLKSKTTVFSLLFLCLFFKIEIRNGNLKAILGLFFSLSRYKQQQHHQQQYYQSLVELQQQVPSPPAEISQSKTHQDMQSRQVKKLIFSGAKAFYLSGQKTQVFAEKIRLLAKDLKDSLFFFQLFLQWIQENTIFKCVFGIKLAYPGSKARVRTENIPN